MVVKKYLRSAPHPSTWDERAASLLESLGGDRVKRAAILKQTLLALGDIMEEKQRTGPGRKSNAEHALAFYRHVLTISEEQDAKTTHRVTTERSKRDPDEPHSDSDESMDSTDFLDQHNDLCDVCNLGGELLCCSTCNLVFHLSCHRPILKQEPPDHWSCAYCIATGLTGYKREAKIRRRAQAAVRLMSKYKENKGIVDSDHDDVGNLEEIESEDEGNKNENGDRGGYSDTEDGGKEKGLNKDLAQKPLSVDDSQIESGNCIKQVGKPIIQESTIDYDDNNNIKTSLDQSERGKIENTDERRARRQRRSPALYDPQTCAASDWQSDGAKERNHLKQNVKNVKGDVDDVVKEDSNDPIWCNFCRDEPNVPVCCFCACRSCFGKHDKSNLLLCDKCDDEYHIYCLDPPLFTVPTARKWFCTSCKNTARREKLGDVQGETRIKSTGTTSRDVVPDKRGPGRPRKSDESSDKLTPDRRGPGRPRKSTELTVSPSSSERRGLGKSRKADADLSTELKESGHQLKPEFSDFTQERRGPGRPRNPELSIQSENRGWGGLTKLELELTIPGDKRGPGKLSKSETDSVEAKSPGRSKGRALKSPPASSQKGVVQILKRSRSPTPQINSTASNDEGLQKRFKEVPTSDIGGQPNSRPGSSGSCSPAPLSIQKSRSGRTVKSKTFHDEIDEGEQHLKVSRPSSSQELFKKEEVTKVKSMPTSGVNEPTLSSVDVGARILPAFSALPSISPAMKSVTELLPVDCSVVSTNDSDVPLLSSASTLSTLPSLPPPSCVSLSPATPSVLLDSVITESTIAEMEPKVTQPGIASTLVVTTKSPIANSIKIVPNLLPVKEPHSVPVVAATGIRIQIPPLNPNFVGCLPPDIPSVSLDGMSVKVPRRKPGARECMQMSRRFGVQVIPQRYMTTLLDYCSRGKVEHLIRMRERLDDHSRLLELQLSGLEALVKERGELNITVPAQADPDTDLDMPMLSPLVGAALPARTPQNPAVGAILPPLNS